MVRLFSWRSKEHVHGIADDLGDGALMGKHDICHARKIIIEQRPEHAGLQRLCQRSEIGDVSEKGGDLAALPTKIERISIFGKALGEIWREIPRQRCVGSFGLRLSLPNLTKIFYVPYSLGDGGFQITEINWFGDKVKCAAVHSVANIAHITIG